MECLSIEKEKLRCNVPITKNYDVSWWGASLFDLIRLWAGEESTFDARCSRKSQDAPEE